MEISAYKLTDLLSSAGATIGIIIAGTIFLQFMSTKAIELTAHYRELTGDYRGGGHAEARRCGLQSQIRICRKRLKLMNYASRLASVALLCMLAAMIAGGMSLIVPKIRFILYLGTITLFTGLFFIGCAVSLEMAENILSRHELGDEIGDLDEPVKSLQC